MRQFSAIFAIAVLFAFFAASNCQAAEYVAGDFEASVQSLGSRTRAIISRTSHRGVNADDALRFQADGDQALRRGDLVHAAEQYGRAEEAAGLMNSERIQAQNARARTRREMERARRRGTDIAQAEIDNQRGDDALDNGDFINADMYYAQARALLASQ